MVDEARHPTAGALPLRRRSGSLAKNAATIDKHELAKSYKRLVRLLLDRGNAVVVGGLDVITAQAVVRLPLGRGNA